MSAVCLIVILLCSSGLQAQLIVAHRGASHDAPENTLAAFRLAWEKHADAIEGDFYLTKDGQIVCHHDKTTERTAPEQTCLCVAESTLEQLRTLDVGRWKDRRFTDERIPTLGEVLATVPDGKRIFVEVKCGTEILPVLKTQLDSSGLKPEQIVIICFNEAVVTESRQLMPHYKANWLISYEQESEWSDWKPARDEVLDSLQRTGATGLGTQGNLDVIDEDFIQAVRDTGKELHVWTVNDVEPANAFRLLNVDSITTDRPLFIRNAVNQR